MLITCIPADVLSCSKFAEGAQACHPLLGPNTLVSFNREYVPVYIIVSKIQLPVDPAIVIPIGGYANDAARKTKASIQGVDKKELEYKTTPEGNKYKLADTGAYVLNEKDNTLCGLSLVGRGKVSLTIDREGTTNDATYEGTMQWPVMWSDLVTSLPLMVGEDIVPVRRQGGGTNFFPGGPFWITPLYAEGVTDVWLEKTLDRLAAICKANDDIPWVSPGTITLDVSRV